MSAQLDDLFEAMDRLMRAVPQPNDLQTIGAAATQPELIAAAMAELSLAADLLGQLEQVPMATARVAAAFRDARRMGALR